MFYSAKHSIKIQLVLFFVLIMHIDLKFVTVLGASDSVESNLENRINL